MWTPLLRLRWGLPPQWTGVCACVYVYACMLVCVRACVHVLTVTPWCIVCGAIVADVLCLEHGALDVVCSASHETIKFAVLMCGSELSVPVPLVPLLCYTFFRMHGKWKSSLNR